MHQIKNHYQSLTIILSVLLLAACGSPSKRWAPIASTVGKSSSANRSTLTLPQANSGRGAYYKDDGPGEDIPGGLELTLDAEPKVEPYSVAGSRPYVVFGKKYIPMTDERPFTQRGIGSWYGKKFHGQRTSSGELYDMYKMTAAHPTLPIPSYARITNVNNGRQVIVRVNDRGPFHSSRIIDLSYTAALKLGYLQKGSSELLLERLLPVDIEKMAENKKSRVTETVASASSYVNAELATPVSLESPIIASAPDSTEGFYLQFGAFGLRANAEATFNRLQNQLTQLPALEIVQQGALYRLFSGPFSTQGDAFNAVELALNAGLPKPIIVQR